MTMVTGVLIILVVMFFPGGFAQIIHQAKQRLGKKKRKTRRGEG